MGTHRGKPLRPPPFPDLTHFLLKKDSPVKRSPFIAASAAAFALILPLSACGGGTAASVSSASSTPRSGGTLTIAEGDQPLSGLDPVLAQSFNAKRLASQFYEGLLSLSADGSEIKPGLASAYEKISDTEYLFTLREGITFHNGEPVTPQDVVYSLERVVNPDVHSPYASLYSLKSVVAEGENQVRITLAAPQASLLRLLAQPWSSGIVNKAWTESTPANVRKTQENGTGPYKLASYAEGSMIKTVAFEGYWDAPKPYIKEVNYRVIADESTLVQALKSKSVDAGQIKLPNNVETVKTSGLTVGDAAATGVQWMAMNTLTGPFTDVNVRRAFSLALDRTKIQQIATLGTGINAGIVPPGDPLGCTMDGSTPYYERSVAKAKDLLKDAEAENVTVNFKIASNSTVAIKAAQLMKEQVAEAGITLNIQTVAYEDMVSSVLSKDWGADMVTLTSALNADASQYVALWFTQGSATSKVNDPQLTTLMNAAKASAGSDEDRKKDYQAICDYVADNAYMVTPYAAPTVHDVWNPAKLEGYQTDVTGTRLFLKEAWIK